MKKYLSLINFINVGVSIIVLLLLILVFRGPIIAQMKKIPAFYYVWQGDENIKKNNFQEAIDNYKIAVSLYPEHVKAIYNLGNIYFWYELYTAQSEKEFVTVYKYDKSSGAHIPIKSKITKKDDALSNAESAYLMATEINPDYINAWINLGLVRIKKYDYVGAIYAFKQATKADPLIINIPFIFNNSNSINYNKAMAFYNLGESYYQLATIEINKEKRRKNLLISLDNFKKSDAIESNLFNTKYNLAITYQLLKEHERAINNYCKAIKISPMEFQGHYNLGVLLREEESYIASADELKKAAMLLDLSEDTNKARYFYALLNSVSFKAAVEELSKLNQNTQKTVAPPEEGIVYSVLIEPLEKEKKLKEEKEAEETMKEEEKISESEKMLQEFARCVTDKDYYEIQQRKYLTPTDWIFVGTNNKDQH